MALLPFLILLQLAFFSVSQVHAICDKPSDDGKTKVAEDSIRSDQRGKVEVAMLCGEDPGLAAARVATSKKTGCRDGEEVLRLATAFQETMKSKGYNPPDVLDPGTADERVRQLKTGGQYSRRAMDHARKQQFKEAAADLLRALTRPGIDPSARDKLMATLEDFLQKAANKNAQAAQDGDLSELFEALDIEDKGTDNSNVDLKQLKRVYRELSVKYHPDKNPESAQRFNQIRDAYEILSDPVKMLLYDTGGMELVKKYEKGDGELEVLEGSELGITVELKDIYEGTQRTVRYSRQIVCRTCRLQPHLPRCRKCRQCPGEIEQQQVWMNQMQYYIEEREIPSPEKCMQATEEPQITIDRGMMGGERVNLPFMGDQRPNRIPGSVTVMIKVAKHPFFERQGDNLLVTVKVSLFEALLGFEREIVHLDGHLVKFGVPRGTVLKPGQGLHIDGEGMPLKEDPSSFGKLIVKFQIEYPDKIPDAQQTALENAMRGIGQGPGQERTTGIHLKELEKQKKRTEL
eukprot:TRINITY_DN24128_c0_g1_i1.p1 TRINITY_DN24128_c0_g1~~TRINITY_DN24128_c0_g1_i1.p1  ORF type:complete len:542 (+),score=103.38 TRINITY_DN24128_c0_g1_i1:78-1628(+)